MNLSLFRIILILMMFVPQSLTAQKNIQSRIPEYTSSDTISRNLSDRKKLEEANNLIARANNKILEARLEHEKTKLYAWITGFSLVLLIFLFFMYRNYITQRLKESVIRNKIASDLHDDIGATLSSISIFSEVALQKMKSNDPSALEVVTKIGDSSRTLLENMSDIVWSINTGNETILAIKERIQTAGKVLLQEMDIDFLVIVPGKDEQVKLNMNQRKNLYLIFKESLNNCAKYSRASLVEVSLRVIEDNIELTIADNGIGFDEILVKKGNGLNNMKKRCMEIDGQLVIQRVNSGGSIIRLSFPVK